MKKIGTAFSLNDYGTNTRRNQKRRPKGDRAITREEKVRKTHAKMEGNSPKHSYNGGKTTDRLQTPPEGLGCFTDGSTLRLSIPHLDGTPRRVWEELLNALSARNDPNSCPLSANLKMPVVKKVVKHVQSWFMWPQPSGQGPSPSLSQGLCGSN